MKPKFGAGTPAPSPSPHPHPQNSGQDASSLAAAAESKAHGLALGPWEAESTARFSPTETAARVPRPRQAGAPVPGTSQSRSLRAGHRHPGRGQASCSVGSNCDALSLVRGQRSDRPVPGQVRRGNPKTTPAPGTPACPGEEKAEICKNTSPLRGRGSRSLGWGTRGRELGDVRPSVPGRRKFWGREPRTLGSASARVHTPAPGRRGSVASARGLSRGRKPNKKLGEPGGAARDPSCAHLAAPSVGPGRNRRVAAGGVSARLGAWPRPAGSGPPPARPPGPPGPAPEVKTAPPQGTRPGAEASPYPVRFLRDKTTPPPTPVPRNPPQPVPRSQDTPSGPPHGVDAPASQPRRADPWNPAGPPQPPGAQPRPSQSPTRAGRLLRAEVGARDFWNPRLRLTSI